MQVRDIMNPHVVSIDPTESAALAARLLARHNVGSLPVCGSGGQLQGMVTDRDIVLRCVAAEEDPRSVPVRSIMSRRPAVVTPEDDVRQAARLMSSQQVRRLPLGPPPLQAQAPEQRPGVLVMHLFSPLPQDTRNSAGTQATLR